MSASKMEYERQPVSKKKKRERAVFRWFIFLVIVSLTFLSGYLSYNYVMDSNDASKDIIANIDPEKGISLEIPMGSSTGAISDILKEKGFVRYPYLFRVLSKINGHDGTYQSGVHILEKDVNYNNLNGYERLMRILSSRPADNPSISVTIPEGLTYKQIVDILYQKKLINKDKFDKQAEDGAFDFKYLKDIPKRIYRLEGYLFPETYKFDAKAGENGIIDKMLKQFETVFIPEYVERAGQLKMSVDQIIILASIIEREAKTPEERPKIAGVFYNRLRSKDKTLNKLQSCATIQYILLNKYGIVKVNITLEDEKIDNPYNTYMYSGLPPGPISSPGRDSIVAALYPEENNYLYFVLKEDGTGTHYFSRTYNEHLKAQALARKNKQNGN